ncbi:trypsin Inhibitor like cysteine rich domain protein [Cooperia oncophora]
MVNIGPQLQRLCVPKPPRLSRCPANESWRNCATLCERTCEQPNPECSSKCGTPRCQCDPGFFRNRSGICKPLSQC